ncbi:MAG: Circadian clock protein KaiC [Myxococcaceae bacterium]|nr:Circadian clock protein KaiC [Myxococcaceae bacterium]
MSEAEHERTLSRVTTGVPGLDAILRGGFLRRAVYMLQGRPGAGKTILANQACFHHVAEGGRAVYVTLLSETHERMLFNLHQLEFFAPACVPKHLSYLSAYSVFEQSGLKGLSEMLRRETRSMRAGLLVVDGLVADERALSSKEFKMFVHDLQIHASLIECTVLLLTSAPNEPIGPEHTMVDGVFHLADRRVGKRAERELEVTKFRGSDYLKGGHAFQITNAGITIFPRFEALYRDPPSEDSLSDERLSSGISSLDRALHGGLLKGSSAVVYGPTGGGKTVLGLHFLNESSESEPGLHFGFYETPQRLLTKAGSLGLSLHDKQRSGVVELMWHPATERVLDDLANRLLAAVRARGVKRLFVDGVEGLLRASPDPDRMSHFMTALTNQLRVLDVTTVYTFELEELLNATVRLPVHGMSAVIENMIMLRFVERGGQLFRTLGIVKLRDSGYDTSVRELIITEHGAKLGQKIQSDSEPRSEASFLPMERVKRMLYKMRPSG